MQKFNLCCAITLCFLSLFATTAHGFQESFEVGDNVEFSFLGNTLQGEVIEAGRGWPKVEFIYRDKTRSQTFPPSRLTFLDGDEVDSNSSGDSQMDSTELTSQMRQWVDSTGDFKIKAKLLSSKNGKVRLEKEDGLIVSLPSNKLSDDDQKFIRDLELQKEKENSADNPFAGGVKKPGSSKRAASGSAKKINAISVENSSNEVALAAKGWNVTPDTGKPATDKGRVVSTPTLFTKHAFHNRPSKISIGPGNRVAALSRNNPFDSGSEIVVVDLANSKSKPPINIRYKESTLLAISSNGETAVTFRKSEGRNPGFVDFWKLGSKAERYASWKTATFFDRGGFSPKSGTFIDGDRLLTIGERIVLWDFETAAALYSIPIDKSKEPAFSANKKQIAVASDKMVFIVDTESGTVLGEIEAPHSAEVLSFSNSGNFLAGINKRSGGIWVWDLVDNKLVRELSAQTDSAKSMIWVGEEYLLVNNSELLDIELRAPVWKYSLGHSSSVVSTNDGRFWVSGDSKLRPIQLPQKRLKDITAKHAPDDLLMLKPGSEVSLVFDLPFAPAEQREIRDRLIENLEANDVTVKDSGTELQLFATIKKGEPQTTEVSNFFDHFGRNSETIKFTPNHASLVLKYKGSPVWSRHRRHGPAGMISIQQGETAQQAANRICQPKPGFFSAVRFPKYISRLPSGKPLGESDLKKR
ncbi:MAG: SHD1 domain-containing protein [Mariniblastus sp.]